MGYVYSPFTGQNWGQATYCDGGGTHNAGIYCCPIDIGGAGEDTPVRFYGSGGIGSIRTIQYSGFCRVTPNPADPWDYGVIVELYKYQNAYCLYGKIFYGHLKNRIANGVYNSPSGTQLGKLAADCNCTCSHGIHSHITRYLGYSNSFSCWQTLYSGSTWIYKWDDSCLSQ